MIKKYSPEIFGIFLYSLLLFPAFEAVEMYFYKGSVYLSFVLVSMLSVLIYIPARLTITVNYTKSLIIGFLSSVLITLLTVYIQAHYLQLNYFWIIFILACSISMFFFFRLTSPQMNSVTYFFGIVLYIFINICAFFHPDEYTQYVTINNILACIFIVLGIFSVGDVNLRNGMRSSEGVANYPSGMQSGTRIMICGILIITFILSCIESIGKGILWVVNSVLFLIARLVDFLVLLTHPIGGTTTEETGIDVEAIIGKRTGEGSPFEIWLIRILGTIALIILAALVVYMLYRSVRYLSKKLKIFWAFLHSKNQTLETRGFIDQHEAVQHDSILSPITKRIRKLFRSEPKEAFNSDASAKEKIRSLYRISLRNQKDRTHLYHLTPEEYFQQFKDLTPEEKKTFSVYYDTARYSRNDMPTDADQYLTNHYQKLAEQNK